jgi:hypothetical protein
MNITVDTREQMPWDLSFYGFTMTKGTVKTGDYSVEGLDLCIERKKNTAEIALNLGSKWKPFKAELDRMVDFKYKFIICEFDIQDIYNFPKGSGIPEREWKNLRVSSKFIQKRLFEETSKRGIEIILAGSRQKAEEKVADLIHNIVKYGI